MSRNIRLYYFSSFLNGLGFFIPIWLLWYTKFISLSTVGLVEGLGTVLGMLLEVPTGAFADNFGRKTSIIIGKTGIAIAAFITAFAFNNFSLILGVFLWNVFYTFINGAHTALIYDDLKSHKKEKDFSQVMARSESYARVGIIIGSFTGGFIYSIWAPLPYFLFGITSLLEVIIWCFMTEPKVDTQKFSFKIYRQTIIDGFYGITHSRHIQLISLISVTIFTYAFLFRSYFDYSYALDLGLNSQSQSVLFGISGIIKLLAIIYIGYQIKIVTRGKLLFTFLFGFGLFLTISNWVGFTGGIIVIFLIEAMSAIATVISTTYLNEELESSIRATAMSFIHMFTSLLMAISLFFGMYFIELYKSPVVYTVFGIILLVLSSVFLFQYWQIKRINSRELQ